MVATGPVLAPGRCGLAEVPPAEIGAQVIAAWDAFLDVARDPATDLSRPSRLPGLTGREVLIHLGAWDDAQVLDGVLESARSGGAGGTAHPDEESAALVASHRDAPLDEVLDALVAARDKVAGFFGTPEAESLGRALSRSTVGPLPVLSLLHAGCYELAVHALDLAPCGAPRPAPVLLDRGLGALLDVTGALAARHDVDIALTGASPESGWRFTSSSDGWTTEPVPGGRFDGVGVRGSAADLLDASAGRAALPQLLVTRRLVVQQLPQWMRLAPLIEEVEGLPGRGALLHAVQGLTGAVSGLGGVLGRLPGRRR